MQAKDLKDLDILKFIQSHHPKWCFLFRDHERSIFNCVPAQFPFKVVLAKMRSLIKRGLVDGCDCGCRGDFTITEKGAIFLNENEKSLIEKDR